MPCVFLERWRWGYGAGGATWDPAKDWLVILLVLLNFFMIFTSYTPTTGYSHLESSPLKPMHATGVNNCLTTIHSHPLTQSSSRLTGTRRLDKVGLWQQGARLGQGFQASLSPGPLLAWLLLFPFPSGQHLPGGPMSPRVTPPKESAESRVHSLLSLSRLYPSACLPSSRLSPF